MTAEHIHDALTLLPADLIAEVGKKRSGKPKVIVWTRYAAMAATVVLVLSLSWYTLLMFGAAGGSKETAALPTTAAQESSNSLRLDSAAAEAEAEEVMETAPAKSSEEAVCGLPTVPASGDTAALNEQNGSLCIDHAHSPAESSEAGSTGAIGGCGNTTATLYYGDSVFKLSGSGAITLSYILDNLEYDPDNLCRCIADHRADTETAAGYEISLKNYFVRHHGGQAALTEEQAEALREIINGLTLEDSLHDH